MYGLIKTSKLGDIGSFGMLSVALYSVAAVIYVLATAFVGSGAA